MLDIVQGDAVEERDYQFSRDFIVQSIVRSIQFQNKELDRLYEVEKKLLKELGYHLESIPGIDTVTACALVAHIGDIKRFPNARKLANYAGVAPVCFSSAGKGRNVQNKSQGNRELYSTLYLLAMQQICVSSKGMPRNPVFLAYFEHKVSEGKTKIQALLCIMRRLVTIIFGMMKYKSVYQLPEVTDGEKVSQGA